MSRNPLPQDHHYIRFSVSPPCSDALLIRRAIQEALTQAFGLTSSNTYVDILSVKENGNEVVIRTDPNQAARVIAAVAISTAEPRLSVQKESPFLPSVSAENAAF